MPEENKARSEETKALALRFVDEAFNKGNLDVFDGLLSPHLVDHSPSYWPPVEHPNEDEGPHEADSRAQELDEARRRFETFRAAFPDMRYDVEDVVSEGDKVLIRGTFAGSHQGEFLGVPATGKRVEASIVDIVRVADGKAVERWNLFDVMRIMRELNVGPTGGVGG